MADSIDTYNPAIRLYDQQNGDSTLFVFDSRHPWDVKRAVRCVQHVGPIKTLTFALEGFDTVTETAGRRTVQGKINLLVGDDTHMLAECLFELPVKSKKGAAEAQHIEYAVRQGVSKSLCEAIDSFYAHRQTPVFQAALNAPAAPFSPYARNMAGDESAANDAGKSNRRNMALAVIGVPVLVVGLYLAGTLMMRPPVNPIEDAVAQAMRLDPASVAAQVELTRKTLEQMGIDPGQSSDLGCLAPK
jgi:hypothetical protein